MELGQGTKDDDLSGGRSSPSGGGDKRRLQDGGSGSGSDSDDEGTRQPYNCAFCRRGFPTAQALGGHMNVHRKDRPSAREAAPPSTVAASRGTACSYGSLAVHGRQAHPATGSDQAAAAAGSLLQAERGAPPQELRLFSHVAGATDRIEYCDAKDGDGDHGEEGDELDLELRLGAASQ